jgi:hypothetical protein
MSEATITPWNIDSWRRQARRSEPPEASAKGDPMRKFTYTRAGTALAGLLALASVVGAGLKW